jgi:septal ring factor EnvC (AmiA/AmiB activator)
VNIFSIILFCFLFAPFLSGQTKRELEEQRKRTLEEITYVDNLLQETSREKNTGITQLKIIGNKLVLRENIISGMRMEIELLTERINLNKLAIGMMEDDLRLMKKDYAHTVINSYKASKGNPELGYILSSRDFNQGYKRLKYLQQVTKFRHREAEGIIELIDQIAKSKEKLEEDLDNVTDLKGGEENQKDLLKQEQERKKRMVNSFGNKERQLRKELEEKKKIAQKIESEIAKILEEEKRKRTNKDLTPEQKLIGENFADNKGRMPWPVEKGIITSQFGAQKHPVLTYVTENNIGIEITSSGKSIARSVFKGEVTAISPISGANMTVIIRHGKYCSVYVNLVNVKVKQGDKVNTKQEIGDVYADPADNFNCVLKFMIFEEQYLDPEVWIAKRDKIL